VVNAYSSILDAIEIQNKEWFVSSNRKGREDGGNLPRKGNNGRFSVQLGGTGRMSQRYS
jgi:hypothetical protein